MLSEITIFDNAFFKSVKWTCGRTYVPKILHFRIMQADKDCKALQDSHIKLMAWFHPWVLVVKFSSKEFI